MAAFALKHIGNRAFIEVLYTLGELASHLGFFELESAGAELVVGAGTELVVSAAQGSHHGNGGGAHVDAAVPEAMQRGFNDEEISAVTWRCRLQMSSPEFIHELLIRLPAACIQQALEDYRAHASVVA